MSGHRPLPVPERVLTIGAHPDDAEFGAGATLAKWASAGSHVVMLVMTDGSKGSWDPEVDQAGLVKTRKREQRAAAERLGATDIVLLDHIDGELENTMALREEISAWIRRVQPDVVLTHDPWQRYQMHPDHRATGWAAVDGVVAAREPLAFAHQLTGDVTHHRPAALLLWSADEPNHWEDAEGFLDAKIAALLEHSSQSETTMGGAGDGGAARDAFRDRIFEHARAAGSDVGMTAAEAFRRLTP